MSAGRVAGKVALVVGAGSGIGRATAQVLAGHGARVLCADLDGDRARETAASLPDGSWCALDVTAEADWERALERLLDERGRLDVLVNSAGVAASHPVAEMELAQWRRVLAVNLDGVFLGTKHGVRAMRRRPEGGSIVNVSSASGIKAAPGSSAYCASKAAVCMFSRTVAKECLEKRDNVRVNTVCPGGVKTPLWGSMPFFQELVARTGSDEAAFAEMAGPNGRWAEPEDVALAILYLASDESRMVTGSDLVIDDGYVG